MSAGGVGFICKTCSGPAPMGVGYTSTEPGAREASTGLDACGCGGSRRPDAAGVEVQADERQLSVRLPSWLTADERQAIADGVRRLVESRGQLDGLSYAARVAGEVRRVMQSDGLDEGHIAMFLGCTRARAAGLWHGWKPFKLDELAAVADALGVPFMSLAAPGVEGVEG